MPHGPLASPGYSAALSAEAIRRPSAPENGLHENPCGHVQPVVQRADHWRAANLPTRLPMTSIGEPGTLSRTARIPHMKMQRLIPMLPVNNISRSIEFYQKLGFTVEQRRGDWGWAMLRFDDCRIMLDESINQWPDAPRQSVLYLYPASVREFHEQVKTAGLVVPELDVTFYGMTEFRIDDPDGNRLWIGQNLSAAQ
jgi:uncharacterized glyoxalase superfamily protein PhnB